MVHRKASTTSVVKRNRCRSTSADQLSSRDDWGFFADDTKNVFWDLLWGDDNESRTMVAMYWLIWILSKQIIRKIFRYVNNEAIYWHERRQWNKKQSEVIILPPQPHAVRLRWFNKNSTQSYQIKQTNKISQLEIQFCLKYQDNPIWNREHTQQIIIYIITNQSLFFSNGMMGSSLVILKETACLTDCHIFEVYAESVILCIPHFSPYLVKRILYSNHQNYFKRKKNLKLR